MFLGGQKSLGKARGVIKIEYKPCMASAKEEHTVSTVRNICCVKSILVLELICAGHKKAHEGNFFFLKKKSVNSFFH